MTKAVRRDQQRVEHPISSWWQCLRLQLKQLTAVLLHRLGMHMGVIIFCMQRSPSNAEMIHDDKHTVFSLVRKWLETHREAEPLCSMLHDDEHPITAEALIWIAHYRLYVDIADADAKGGGATSSWMQERFELHCGGASAPPRVVSYLNQNISDPRRAKKWVQKFRKRWGTMFRRAPMRNGCGDEETREKARADTPDEQQGADFWCPPRTL